jgi:hypothetical protein
MLWRVWFSAENAGDGPCDFAEGRSATHESCTHHYYLISSVLPSYFTIPVFWFS